MPDIGVELRESNIVGKNIKVDERQGDVMELLLISSGWVSKEQIMQRMCSNRMEFVLGADNEANKILKELVKNKFVLHCSINGHHWYKISKKVKEEMIEILEEVKKDLKKKV